MEELVTTKFVETDGYADICIKSKFKVGDKVYNRNECRKKFNDMTIIKILFVKDIQRYQFRYLCELKNMERLIFPECYLEKMLDK